MTAAPGLPRLFAGLRADRPLTLGEHFERRGALADVAHRREALIRSVAAAGLRGRGGGAFPTAVKLRAVAASRGRRTLVVNAAEGEPMSAKDRVLLELAPHLVLDGALLAAEAVGTRDIVVAVKNSAATAHAAVRSALAERRDAGGVRLETVPDAYIAGEESALLNRLGGGPAKPTLVPPRPHERGLGRRPTLVSNVETLAHVALIARHGASWFRELGTAGHPGSALVTVAGSVERPGVHEVALGTPLAQMLAGTGAPAAAPRAVLVGGYYGSWLGPESLAAATLDDESLLERGAALGAGVLVALPAGACPAAEVARVMRWMADENAGQCGPCVHGLDAIARSVASLVAGTAATDELARIERWSSQVRGRGACHHPDGVVRFLRSALAVFAGEFEDHRRYGPCDACRHRPVLDLPDTRGRLAA
jgi:NADH:ubiquinone oxidoreductase subunit F (NADH-binding)